MFIAAWKLAKNCLFCTLLIGTSVFSLASCNGTEVKSRGIKTDYIREIPGENDSIPAAIAQKGEVLIAYSDCYTCHTENKRSVGPAFKDIARRYPVQQAYISMLAQKIISGGSGSWGRAVMIAHPNVTHRDAEVMVNYILSLKEEL
jgi:cytochrome c